MKYYIDTEFNSYRGELISMAIVREDGRSLYLVLPFDEDKLDPWVLENVVPVLTDSPEPPQRVTLQQAPFLVEHFLSGDEDVHLVADWPTDHQHFCHLIEHGPGDMIFLPHLTMEVVRVDAYPTVLQEAVQHNAWWDAVALRAKLQGDE